MNCISRLIFSSFRSAAVALLLWLTLLSAAQADEEMPVTVVVARPDAVLERVSVVGSLIAREEVEVRPLVEERAITDILVEVGQTVAKEQPLAVFDTTEALMLLDKNVVSTARARAAVEVEAARLDVARVIEADAKKALQRNRTLQQKGVVSQQVLDEHETAHARALAELNLARQSLKLAEADAELIARERREILLTIERSTVKAPAPGMVLRKAARLGAMASGSADPLFVIAKDGAIEFVAQVTETSFVRLSEGMRAQIVLPGSEIPLGGTLRLNAAEIDPATRSGEVRIELDQTGRLTPGVFARGIINVTARRNILVPGSAVKTGGGQSSVFVVKDGIVNHREVSVGTRQDGLVEIIAGVEEGELVVLKSAGFLKDQEKVRPVVTAWDPRGTADLATVAISSDRTGAVR